jgi:glutamine amidotransferase
MHNGFVGGFAAVKRDLVLAVDESLFPKIKGTTDTEVLFYLALSLGLQDDPPGAVARAIWFVEACGRRRGVEHPFQGTIATSDGQSLWVFRYSSEGRSRSLFHPRRPPAPGAVPGPGDLGRGVRRHAAGGLGADR